MGRKLVTRAVCAVFAASLVVMVPLPVQAIQCGVWRWPVKTLSDSLESKVNFHPVGKSVDYLRNREAPSSLSSDTPRLKGVERTTYEIHVGLKEAVVEDDHDVHLVVYMPGHRSHTMIVELPYSRCNGVGSSPKKVDMKAARAAFTAACGSVGSSFISLKGKATITGVGFFDEIHGQTGVAPNGIELHPVLGFSSSNCART